MFCKNCGKENKEDSKFCIACGNSLIEESISNKNQPKNTLSEKWWYRLFKVTYILMYIPLLVIIIATWYSNKPYCSYYYSKQSCYGSYSDAFWYSLLALIIGITVLRLIKISFIYVIKGQRPKWKKEFKKIY
jgi:hypothetical protein